MAADDSLQLAVVVQNLAPARPVALSVAGRTRHLRNAQSYEHLAHDAVGVRLLSQRVCADDNS